MYHVIVVLKETAIYSQDLQHCYTLYHNRVSLIPLILTSFRLFALQRAHHSIIL